MIILLQMAFAAPLQMTQQGRLLDANQTPIEGAHILNFKLYDDISAGNMLWEDEAFVYFVNGYYSTVLGADEIGNPLDESVLSTEPLYLELKLNLDPPFSPRMPLYSVPYAQMTNTAKNVKGGDVDVLGVSINGALVIDSSGAWVGPTPEIGWNDVDNIPQDLLDGDDDTQLSEETVETMVTNDPIDLATGSQSGSSPILTESSNLEWGKLVNVPQDLQDGDAEGIDLMCAEGEMLLVESGAWTCKSFSDSFDIDQDGVLVWADCDDSNADIPALDADCDGILTADDCNDADSSSTTLSEDGDCDGVVTADDCDDTDSSSTTLSEDGDCDGIVTALDCDDNNANAVVGTGTSAGCAAASCLDILDDGYSSGDGAYWLTHDGVDYQAYCDMTTDGGGWTLVGKVEALEHNADSGVLDGHDSERWLNKNYLGNISGLSSENALGRSYEAVSFTDFMLMGLSDTNDKLAWRMGQNFDSLYSVFSTSTTYKTTDLLLGDFTTLDWKSSCGTGSGPNSTGPHFYGFNIYADSADESGSLVNGFSGGWCAALAGWGRDNSSSDYTGGGLGASCQGRGHQMGRHYWGYGDGCTLSEWQNGGSYDSFNAHAFFVR
ncbi:MAG: hypothetical protein CMK59_15270 [Proteobacteria bacterium]|nr:hypothetical protein [Pseudomonadota bacterium]